jgi:CBS domain containing-hemolysin-like protein
LTLDEESDRGLQRWLKTVFRRLGRLDRPQDLEKEIQQLIDEGEERGVISEDEGEMIQSIFSFRDTVAREIMVPRPDAVFARDDISIGEIIEHIISSGHSRIPIFNDNIDNIIGIVHAKDLLQYWGTQDTPVREIVRPPYFIPETKKISELLKDLRDKKSHMAIVIDEYGGTAGILTLEDIIEEIIGDIMDEYDSEVKQIVEQHDGSILVDARLDVEDLEDYLHIEFPEGKFESVGGFIINVLGKVPDVNEKVIFQNLEMIIDAADSRKIEKIRIRRLSSEEPGGESAADLAIRS